MVHCVGGRTGSAAGAALDAHLEAGHSRRPGAYLRQEVQARVGCRWARDVSHDHPIVLCWADQNRGDRSPVAPRLASRPSFTITRAAAGCQWRTPESGRKMTDTRWKAIA